VSGSRLHGLVLSRAGFSLGAGIDGGPGQGGLGGGEGLGEARLGSRRSAFVQLHALNERKCLHTSISSTNRRDVAR